SNYTEQEAPGSHSNENTPEPVSVNVIISGTLDPVGDGGVADFDVFGFSANAGDLLRITLAARGATTDFQPFFEVDDAAVAAYSRSSLLPTTPAVAKRELFIDTTGNYIVTVADARNLNQGGTLVGGFDYTLTIERVPVSGTALPLPVNDQTANNTR